MDVAMNWDEKYSLMRTIRILDNPDILLLQNQLSNLFKGNSSFRFELIIFFFVPDNVHSSTYHNLLTTSTINSAVNVTFIQPNIKGTPAFQPKRLSSFFPQVKVELKPEPCPYCYGAVRYLIAGPEQFHVFRRNVEIEEAKIQPKAERVVDAIRSPE